MKYLLSLCSLFLFNISFAQQDWTLINTKEQIKIYKKTDAQQRTWYRLGMEVKSNFDQITSVLTNAQGLIKWLDGCSKVKLLKDAGNTKYIYTVTDLSFPMTDRDCIIRQEAQINEAQKSFKMFSTTDDTFKHKSDLVHIEEMKANWEVTPKSEGTYQMFYELYVDIGSNIPAWLSDRFLVVGPFRSMKNLRKILTK